MKMERHRPEQASQAAGTLERHPYIEQDNAASLHIYRRLKEAVHECEPLAAPHLNVVAIFFPDLMRILTGYDLRVRELSGPYRPQAEAEFRPVKSLPYIGFSDVASGIDPDSKKYGLVAAEVPKKYRLVSAASRALRPVPGASGAIAIAKPSALDLRRLMSAMLKGLMRLTFPSPTPLAIPGLDDQLRCLGLRVEEISDDLGWSDSPAPITDVICRHIRALAVEGEPQRVNYQALVCGSLALGFNRLIAARTMAVGAPVVTISHGAGEGMHDEPIFGYGERSFATAMLGFGPAGMELSKSPAYARSLHQPPEYFESDAPDVLASYLGPEVDPLDSMEGKAVFYVPTSFSGNIRYGPFRDMPDRMYLRWQEALFREFPDATWKGYPEAAYDRYSTVRQLIPGSVKRISRVYLKDCLRQADVLIFDYVSTAFCEAAATSKPIIFLDIGLRNHSRAAQRAISDRCIYLRVDPENPGPLKEQILSLGQKSCVNTFSPQFSLATDGLHSGRIAAALEVVRDLLR